MDSEINGPHDPVFVRNALEATIRIALVALVLVLCYFILRPFVAIVAWAVIMAVAVYPLFQKLQTLLNGRTKMAAALIVIAALLLLVIPSFLLFGSLVDGVKFIAQAMEKGTLHLPMPSENVSEWPVIGKPLSEIWHLSSANLETVVKRIAPLLKSAGGKIFTSITSIGLGMIQFVLSIIIAGVLLAYTRRGHRAIVKLFERLVGERGADIVEASTATIRGVALGVIGVAVIQSLMAGVGLVIVGVPGAGLWAFLILLLAVMQLPPILVLGPIVIFLFSVDTYSTGMAVFFTIWSLLLSVSDNLLKPLLMGRGLAIPMLVIMIGAIGGMMLMGIIGLFVGSVVLSIGYQLFDSWLSVHVDEAE